MVTPEPVAAAGHHPGSILVARDVTTYPCGTRASLRTAPVAVALPSIVPGVETRP